MSTIALQDIQPGDHVIYTNGNRQRGIRTVERTTKTQIILTSGSRFRRSDGYPVGSDEWTLRRVDPATDELLAEVKDEQARRVVRNELNNIAKQVQDPKVSLTKVTAALHRMITYLDTTTAQ